MEIYRHCKASARYTHPAEASVPKLKPEEVETRSREIIEAARRCFLRNGFHQTTTDDICREAAMTPGGLYHYFGSKEEIISAVIGGAAQDAVKHLGTMAAAAVGTRAPAPAKRKGVRGRERGGEAAKRDVGAAHARPRGRARWVVGVADPAGHRGR